MNKFEESMKAMSRMSAEEQKKILEAEKAKCICPTCPTYNNCAKNAKEMMFCWTGRSFMCISLRRNASPHLPGDGRPGTEEAVFCTRAPRRPSGMNTRSGARRLSSRDRERREQG